MIVKQDPPPIATRSTTTPSAATRVLEALEAHGEPARPSDLKAATGMSSALISNTLRSLTKSERVVRWRDESKRNGPGASYYGLPGQSRPDVLMSLD